MAGREGRARKGTGGHGRRRLEGRGPTLPARSRPGHPAQRRAATPERRRPSPPAADGPRRSEAADLVVGRNAVVESLRAGLPARSLLLAVAPTADRRVGEAVKLASAARVPLVETARAELDRLTAGAVHQGVALTVAPYRYRHPDDLLVLAERAGEPALFVALDGITDPHNLGAVARSAAAFGAHGICIPERRAVGVTPAAWKASAGALARVPVAMATNLARTLAGWRERGLTVVGLDAAAALSLADLQLASAPVALVVGAEHRGLSRLVAQHCDLRVAIPIRADTESLNASVASGIALHALAVGRG